MVIGEVPIGADVLVIGGGAAGGAVALALAGRGRRVVVADESGAPGVPRGLGVTVLAGRARFSTPRRVAVSDGEHVVHVEAAEVVVATGSGPGSGALDERLVARASPAVREALLAHGTPAGGRSVVVDDLGLGPDRLPRRGDGSIIVDAAGRVGPHLYAVGAVTGRPDGYAAAEAAAVAAAIAGEPGRFDAGVEPVVVDLGDGRSALSVGAPAAARSGVVDLTPDGPRVEVVVDEAGTVVGVHAVGRRAADLAHGATLAVELAVTVEEVVLTAATGPALALALAALAVASTPHGGSAP